MVVEWLQQNYGNQNMCRSGKQKIAISNLESDERRVRDE